MEGRTDTWVEVDDNGIGWEIIQHYATHATVYHQNDHQTRKQLPVVVKNFHCSVCKSRKFDTIYHHPNGSDHPFGGRSHETVYGPGPIKAGPVITVLAILEYRCALCTTRFGDPAKFSRNQPPQIVAPVATKRPNRSADFRLELNSAIQ